MKEEKLKSELMPTLFLGHGSPMNAIEKNSFTDGFRRISEDLPKPVSILCISAHWYTSGTHVTSMEKPRTIHDFGGFPRELYEVQYPADGNPALASQVIEILKPIPVGSDVSWGLDHGAWSVLKHLYPGANIPVIQLSIDYTKPALFHYDLARRLSPLREKGVLIIGSGNIVHNLGLVDFQNLDKQNYGYDWALEARQIINRLIIEGNHSDLINYHSLPKAVHLAVPTPEHFLPLLYILALKDKEENIKLFNDEMVGGSISMTSAYIT